MTAPRPGNGPNVYTTSAGGRPCPVAATSQPPRYPACSAATSPPSSTTSHSASSYAKGRMNTRPSNARSSADPLVAARHVVGWLLDLSHISWRITREPPRRCQEPYASEQAEWGDEPPAAVTGGGAVARAAVPVLRTPTVKDLDSIGAVMRASVLALFPACYDERQTASAAVHIAHVDPVLVA